MKFPTPTYVHKFSPISSCYLICSLSLRSSATEEFQQWHSYYLASSVRVQKGRTHAQRRDAPAGRRGGYPSVAGETRPFQAPPESRSSVDSSRLRPVENLPTLPSSRCNFFKTNKNSKKTQC